MAPLLPITVHTRGKPRPLPPSVYTFPDPRTVDAQGVVGWGGDFAPSTIIEAYRHGIFPWPHPGQEYLWFSPDPRAIIPVGGVHVSRRLARTLRQGRFRFTVDAAFDRVLEGCADRPEGTWITPAYMDGYSELHRLGWAHSVEAWTQDGELAGGLYGIRVQRMFGAESMFHAVTDASKAALVAFDQWAASEGVTLIDVQVISPHTERMGAIDIPRDEYLARLAEALKL